MRYILILLSYFYCMLVFNHCLAPVLTIILILLYESWALLKIRNYFSEQVTLLHCICIYVHIYCNKYYYYYYYYYYDFLFHVYWCTM